MSGMRTGRIAAVALTLALVTAASSLSSEIGLEIASQINEASYRHYLDEELYTRVGQDKSADGAEHDLTRDNIVAIFESFGLQVELHTFHHSDETFYNVVATKPGTVEPDAQIVLGAHYDSLSNPGADDDASGVAALLEIARVLSAYETELTVKFIAFDLNEMGLTGSRVYVADHFDDDIRGMLQLDMIAWDCCTYKCVIMYHQTDSLPWAEQFRTAAEEYGNDLIVRYIAWGSGSDHASFCQAGIPACLLTENRHYENPFYHSSADTVDYPGYISYEYARDMTRSAAGFIADQAGAYHPADCDENGIADADQIAADPALDCNGNQILDTCEFGGGQDLNGNGVPDFCDIGSGFCSDCNGNWIPDECESGHADDCNDNGVPDLCDVAVHTSEDLNRNGVPDECEAHGTVYVDDDAPNDPAPGDPERSDPDENGSLEHPFDSIGESLGVAVSGDEILVRAGVYTGTLNRDMNTQGRELMIRGEAGPDACIVDLEDAGLAFTLVPLADSSAVIEGFSFINGRRALKADGGTPVIANCVFANNEDNTIGGGAVCCVRTRAAFVNCMFAGNVATRGGAVYCWNGRPVCFRGCTFTGNQASRYSGAIGVGYGFITMTNCILWGNEAPVGAELGGNLGADGVLSVSFCNVAGGIDGFYLDTYYPPTIEWGPGNIDVDPLFADPNDGDFRLLPGSPCIDAGANALVPPDYADLDGDGNDWGLTPFDLDYEGRFFDDPNTPDTGCGGTPVVDMGACEFGGTGPTPCVGDIDGDRDVDLSDLAALLASYNCDGGGDLDCDGDTDLADLAALLAGYGVECP